MIAIAAELSTVWGERLGWMLVHSVWEIGAIALIYAFILLCMPRGAASARYMAGFVALVCMILSLPITLACNGWNPSPSRIAMKAPGRVITAHSAEQSATRNISSKATIRDETF